jgi:hypothetical protein
MQFWSPYFDLFKLFQNLHAEFWRFDTFHQIGHNPGYVDPNEMGKHALER